MLDENEMPVGDEMEIREVNAQDIKRQNPFPEDETYEGEFDTWGFDIGRRLGRPIIG